MTNFYYVAKAQREELKLQTNLETVLCLSDDPFRNWIIGFDIFENSIEGSDEVSLGMEYEVLRIPNETPEIEITNNKEELETLIREIVLNVLNSHLESSIQTN